MIETKRRGRPPKVETDLTDPSEKIPGASETATAPVEEKGNYMYRSKDPFTIGLQIPKIAQVRQPNGTYVDREIKQRIQVKFDDSLHTLVVNEGLANALDTTVADLNHYLKKWPSYGISFVQVAGPGFKPSQAILEFDRACMKTVDKKKGKSIIQGAKSSSNVS